MVKTLSPFIDRWLSVQLLRFINKRSATSYQLLPNLTTSSTSEISLVLFRYEFFLMATAAVLYLGPACNHFLNKIGGYMSFYGATDTPVLDFWWCLLWVSKPKWAALFTLGRGICDVCSLRFTSGVTPAELLMASMVTSHCSPHVCFSRMPNLNMKRRALPSNALTMRSPVTMQSLDFSWDLNTWSFKFTLITIFPHSVLQC